MYIYKLSMSNFPLNFHEKYSFMVIYYNSRFFGIP